jgi:hypothetical protein
VGYPSRNLAAIAHHVTNTGIVTTLKTCAIVRAKPFGDVGVAKLIAVVHVGRTMVLVIFACPNYSILKSASLRVVELRRRGVPPTAVAVARWRRPLWRRILAVDCSRGP